MDVLVRSAIALALTIPLQVAPANAVDTAVEAGKAAARFPQVVRVGDLPGRKLLGPAESQPILGRVSGVVRRPNGGASLVVDIGGLFGVGTRQVAVPIDTVGLLGEHVALLDITPDQLRGLPTFDLGVASKIAPDETIRVGLTKPFH